MSILMYAHICGGADVRLLQRVKHIYTYTIIK